MMGSVARSSEQELDGHIEVACTAHASTGVRRLVKSVVRGIKVRIYTATAAACRTCCALACTAGWVQWSQPQLR